MAQYEEHNQLDYRFGGDTIDDFAQKYMAEMTRVFRFLNDLKENKINSIEYTEPSAGQFKVEDEKLYIRDGSNTRWVLLGDIDENFGFKPAEATFLNSKDIGSEAGQIPVLNEDGILDVSISGNAGKIAGIRNEVNNIQDGEVLTYRAATNSWRNEPKGVIGAGKSLNLYDGEELLCAYSGDEPQNFDMRFTENQNKIDAVVEEVKETVDRKINAHNASSDAHADKFSSPIAKWVSGAAYKADDIRINDDKIWMCVTPNNDAEFDEDKWVNIGGGGSGAVVGDIKAIVYNGDVEEGWLLCNGASVSREMYPDLFVKIGTTWGAVDESHFNLPDLRGRFTEGAEVAGQYKDAGLPNITGNNGNGYQVITDGNIATIDTGAFSYTHGRGLYGNSAAANEYNSAFTFDASRSSSIYGNSTTVQPPSATVRYIIKAFDSATADSALVDMTQIVNELNRHDAEINAVNTTKMDLERDYTIIYPNGGSEESPATVKANTRYVMDNPFPDYMVACDAEILFDGKWGNSGWYTAANVSKGIKASALSDKIVLQTGNTQISVSSFFSGDPFGKTNGDISTAPCRIKVWKIGKKV